MVEIQNFPSCNLPVYLELRWVCFCDISLLLTKRLLKRIFLWNQKKQFWFQYYKSVVFSRSCDFIWFFIYMEKVRISSI